MNTNNRGRFVKRIEATRTIGDKDFLTMIPFLAKCPIGIAVEKMIDSNVKSKFQIMQTLVMHERVNTSFKNYKTGIKKGL